MSAAQDRPAYTSPFLSLGEALQFVLERIGDIDPPDAEDMAKDQLLRALTDGALIAEGTLIVGPDLPEQAADWPGLEIPIHEVLPPAPITSDWWSVYRDHIYWRKTGAIWRKIRDDIHLIRDIRFRLDDLERLWPAQRSNSNAGAQSPLTRIRGRPPEKRNSVVQQMKDYLARGNNLAAMKEEEMASYFEASRDTCRRARVAVLSVNGGNSISDK